MSNRNNNRKSLIGKVVSNKMEKTAIVEVNRRVPHPIYKKYINKSKKYYAHDEKNECTIGDIVKIMETRPISNKKRWRLLEIQTQAEQI
tara:strand:- start:1029 stop:1295 length:267 start_codon:yes stop_codon:yes gene_type:complete